MTCNNYSGSADDRYLSQQEHRNINRLWGRTLQNASVSKVNLSMSDDTNDIFDKRGVRFGQKGQCDTGNICDPNDPAKKFPSEAVQKKLAKGKSFAKKKSPLQKFDEVVTRELTSRRMAEDEGMPSFEGSKNWSTLQFSSSKFSDFGRSKISTEHKVSRGLLSNVEKEVKPGDPGDVENAYLMDAIEKLAQAQALCRFDAAVKAAEAATASVPPEKAEEVAMACARDYQSEIVDVINEKIPTNEDKKPIEVIGYIGVTKMRDCV
ncbi:hypothetical protein RUM43_006826 [Polyplax serrata]|uniref:Uncharacterized protein n=1 Tax=Polyplax serrata TaxID=468196 RepID=A0AAN8P110_POLSC